VSPVSIWFAESAAKALKLEKASAKSIIFDFIFNNLI
jgi:hypothetical protein